MTKIAPSPVKWQPDTAPGLVSVIMPCFNAEAFVATARP